MLVLWLPPPMRHVTHVMCHMSYVSFQVSGVRCQVSGVPNHNSKGSEILRVG